MRWVCAFKLGHPEDLEEKLCCPESVSPARCSPYSTQTWWLPLQVSSMADWHMDQEEKTVGISLFSRQQCGRGTDMETEK